MSHILNDWIKNYAKVEYRKHLYCDGQVQEPLFYIGDKDKLNG